MNHTYTKTPKLEARNSRDVFMLFSALNAIGYNTENNIKGMTIVRKEVRRVLLKYDWNKKYPHLKKVLKTHHPWHLLNTIFARPKNIKTTSIIGHFIVDLRKFSKEPVVLKLWKTLKNYQAKETKKLLPLLKRVAIQLIGFIKIPARQVNKIIIMANPLDAYWSGYVFGAGIGFWTGKKGINYIVAGPGTKEDHNVLIHHELLHILAPSLELPTRITAGQNSKRLAVLGYISPRVINREYIVRSLYFLYELEVLKRDISTDIKREEKDFPNIREVMALVNKNIHGNKKGGAA